MSKLYLIPTPIGNLDDITIRAVNILKQLDFLLAEDTRKTGILLQHLGIKLKLVPYHSFNEHKVLQSIIDRIKSGNVAGLASDAGTPGISDPGFLLVRECINQSVEVECLPGPVAFVPALINSGLPNDRFCFEGFLPVKKGRRTRLEQLKEETRTMVFYESPHKLLKTFADFIEVFGPERRAGISRELTKIHEENVRGTLTELLEYYQKNTLKGEITLTVSGKQTS